MPIHRLRQLTERVGLPLRLNFFNIIGKGAEDATELAFEPTFAWYVQLLRVLDSPADPLFARHFGRIAIAQLSEGVLAARRQQLNAWIRYWLSKISSHGKSDIDANFLAERLRLALEALCDLV